MCPIITPDFSAQVQPLSAGSYVCSIEGAELKTSPRTGTQYINWQLATQPDKYIIYHITPIEGRGAGMFKHFVSAAGGVHEEGASFDTDSILGCEVRCELEEEQYTWNGNEKIRMKVKAITPHKEPVTATGDIPF